MRSIRKTTPCLMAALLGLASVSAFAQQDPAMNGDPNPTWQRHGDGSTSGWQGDRPQPAPGDPGMAPGATGQPWHAGEDGGNGHRPYDHRGDGYANDHHDDGAMRVRHQGDVAFVSGGVGLDESRALLREGQHYPLMLSFLGSNREYLSDVHVKIVGTDGDEVLSTAAQGPYLLARLPSGRYTVRVAYHGREQVRRIAVSNGGHVRSTFVWSTHDD